MTLLTTRKRNGSLLRDVVEDFFTPDAFSSIAPGFFTSLPNLVFDRMPNANIVETDEQYQIELAAPGLKKEDFELEIDNGNLSISVRKEESAETKGKNFMRQEFSYESFSRSFYLPENIKVDKIDARYDNGILRVLLPKSELMKKLPTKKLKVS